MATVKDRFEHLGLAYNNKILMIVGVHISDKFKDMSRLPRTKKFQDEGGEEYFVWDYPDSWNKEMDRLILIFLEHYLDLKTDVRNGSAN